jgi:hypothetical protein
VVTRFLKVALSAVFLAFVGAGCSAKISEPHEVKSPVMPKISDCNCPKGTVTNKTIKRTNIKIEDHEDCGSNMVYGGTYKSILSE